jgi:hypothetical protein
MAFYPVQEAMRALGENALSVPRNAGTSISRAVRGAGAAVMAPFQPRPEFDPNAQPLQRTPAPAAAPMVGQDAASLGAGPMFEGQEVAASGAQRQPGVTPTLPATGGQKLTPQLPKMPSVDSPTPVQTVSSTPNGAVAGSGGSPIIQQYNTLQGQKMRDLEIERAGLTNMALKNALTLDSPYNTVGTSMQLARQARLGASLARTPGQILPQETEMARTNAGVQSEQIRGQTLRDVEGLRGETQRDVTGMQGDVARDVEGMRGEAGRDVARTTSAGNVQRAAIEGATQLRIKQPEMEYTQRKNRALDDGQSFADVEGKATPAPRVTVDPSDPNGAAYVSDQSGVKRVTRAEMDMQAVSAAAQGAQPGVPFAAAGKAWVKDPKTGQVQPYGAPIPTTGVRG